MKCGAKRALALLLSVTMCLSLLPITALADGEAETTPEPTAAPTAAPTEAPTPEPTAAPTPEPTAAPTAAPTEAPVIPSEAKDLTEEAPAGEDPSAAPKEDNKEEASDNTVTLNEVKDPPVNAPKAPETVKVIFRLTPAEAVVTVYTKDEAGKKAEIKAESDGSYLLLPGRYFYTLTAEGFEMIEDEKLTVPASDKPVEISVTLSETKELVEELPAGAPSSAEPPQDDNKEEASPVIPKERSDEGSPTTATNPDNAVIPGEAKDPAQDVETAGDPSSAEPPQEDHEEAVEEPSEETETPEAVTNAAAKGLVASGECGESLTWTLNDQGELTISGSGAMANYTTSAPAPWNDHVGSITSIVMDDAVTAIGDYAFTGCAALSTVTIPSGLTSVGSNAFKDCAALTGVVLPASVTTIGSGAFNGCSAMDTITAPRWRNTYGTQIRHVIVPEGSPAVVNSAFYNATNLESITVPDGVTSIGTSAFFNCTGLTKLSLPASVTTIANNSFSGCTGLTTAGPAGGAYDYTFVWTESIPANAFSACAGLTAITLPGTVTAIGSGAFSGCSALESMALPSGLAEIDSNLFYNCSSLRTVTIRNGLTGIGANAFANCSALESVTIPGSVTTIGENAFADCSSLSRLSIPDSVSTIGENAFQSCSSIRSAGPAGGEYDYTFAWTDTFPANAFSGLTYLSAFTFPEGFTDIPEAFFSGCSSLENVTLPESVTTIGAEAFKGTGLRTIVLPETITTIEARVFEGCGKLQSIVFPESVTSIGERAFFGCSLLASVAFPESLTTIGDYAFYGCSGMISVLVPGSVTSIGKQAFLGCNKLTSLVLPEGVSSIDYYAFLNCSALTTISLPQSLTRIGQDAFGNCPLQTVRYAGSRLDRLDMTIHSSNADLLNVEWEYLGTDPKTGVCGEDMTWTLYVDGRLVIAGTGEMYDYSSNNSPGTHWSKYRSLIQTCEIGSGVSNISNNAFSACSVLTSVTIPASVTSIGDSAFRSCALESVAIPASVTSIGSNAFGNCYALESIAIPASVTSIGEYAFRYCSALTSVTISEGVTSIGSNAFGYCPVLTSVTIPASVTDIAGNAFSNCGGLTTAGPIGGDYNICFGWTDAIPAGAFSDCSNLTSVTIPEGVTTIGNYAFYNCTGLTSVTIPEGVTTIGDGAFSCCTGLTRVTIPESVTSMGSYTPFFDCTGLTTAGPIGGDYNICFGWTDVIPAKTFRQHRNLSSVTIPEGVTSIGDRAFEECTGLTSVTIPESMTSIGYMAFSTCSGLKKVIYYGIPAQRITISIDRNNDPLINAEWEYRGTGISGPCGESLTWTIDADNVLTIRGEGDMPDYEASERPWYKYLEAIEKVVLEAGVTHIGNNAFIDCSNLAGATIPASVASIGIYAFSRCSSLTSVAIPEGVTTIGSNAFSSCTGLTSVTIPEGVTSLGTYAFGSCTGLTSLTIPKSLTTISEFAFPGCTGLTSVTIPEGVTAIGSYAFRGCTGLTSVEIPASMKTVDGYAFFECSSLQKVVYGGSRANRYDISIRYGNDPLTDAEWEYRGSETITGTCGEKLTWSLDINGVLTIRGTGAMEDYYGGDFSRAPWYKYKEQIGSAIIETGVTTIGGYIFQDCTGLTSVTIPGTVTSIGNSAFSYCTGLTSVTIPGTVTSIGDYAFSHCTSLTEITIPEGVKSIGNDAFSRCTGLTRVTIPEGVTGISMRSFEGCTGLTSITIPASVRSIDIYSFNGCSALKTVIYGGIFAGRKAMEIDTGNTPLINAEWEYRGTEMTGTCGDDLTWHMDANNVLTIRGTGAMQDYIDDPGSPWSAFGDMIETVVLEEGVTTIGSYAFDGCTGLTSVTIPEGVTSIGVAAFQNCTALSTVRYVGTEARWAAIRISGGNDALSRAKIEYVTCDEVGQTHTPGETKRENEKAATCTEAGSYDEVVCCAVCDKELSRETKSIEKLPHTPGEAVRENEVAATPTAEGHYDEVVYCSVCGEELSREEKTLPKITANFTDVADPSAYFYEPVYWAKEKGVTSGKTATTFDPYGPCTRGQIVTFLWRALGEPEPTNLSNPFTDVKTTDYFYKPVLWAKEKGITSGKTATSFAPYAACTRGQCVTFLWRAAGEPAPRSIDGAFKDVKSSDYFYQAVYWAKENGITSGTTATTFAPNKGCTRGQIVTFLYRYSALG